jgi:hypothetical protein
VKADILIRYRKPLVMKGITWIDPPKKKSGKRRADRQIRRSVK